MKFEQNRTVPNIQNFELFGNKRLPIFEKSVEAILEDISVT